MTDYLIIKDGTAEVPNDAAIIIPADGVSSKELIIQKKNSSGADTDAAVPAETIAVMPRFTLLAINKSSEALSVSGSLSFTVGPDTKRGEVVVVVEDQAGTLLPRTIRLRFS